MTTEAKIDKILESIHNIEVAHESRLSKLETKQTGIITISGLIFTGIITYILNFFQLKG